MPGDRIIRAAGSCRSGLRVALEGLRFRRTRVEVLVMMNLVMVRDERQSLVIRGFRSGIGFSIRESCGGSGWLEQGRKSSGRSSGLDLELIDAWIS